MKHQSGITQPNKVKQGDGPGPAKAAPGLFVIKLHHELSAAALRDKLDKELALWYELQSVNVIGCGKLILKDVLPVLVSSFGYSPDTVYRILKAGEGRFWEVYQSPGLPGRWVRLRGLSPVAESLGSSSSLRP